MAVMSLEATIEHFKVLSDLNRVRILHLIWHNEEMCISDLELILDFTQTKTSRHLIYMKNAGILSYRKYDQWVYYYVPEKIKERVSQLLSYFSSYNELQNDLEEYRTLYANNELAIRRLHNKQKKYKLPEL